jgi:hypothetical protein
LKAIWSKLVQFTQTDPKLSLSLLITQKKINSGKPPGALIKEMCGLVRGGGGRRLIVFPREDVGRLQCSAVQCSTVQ